MRSQRVFFRLLPFALVLMILVPAACRPVWAFAGYHEETLGNGLRVILIEHRANPMIAASVVVSAGVVYEPEGMNGASHLLEHLLFNGTETRTQRQLYDDVDRYGAYNNATTHEDHTLFSLLIQKEFIEKGLEIQADMLFHSTIPAENFEKEKGIVLEEMARDEEDAGNRAGGLFRRAAFPGTPLARPVLGTRESISAVSRDGVWTYYKARYTPANMVLVLMGDFDELPMMAAVQRTFGAAAAGSRIAPSASASWPPRPEKNVTTGPLESERRYLFATFPLELSPYDPLMPAVELLLQALAGGADSPLQRELTSGADPAAFSAGLSAVPRTAPWSTVDFDATLPKDKPIEPVLDRLAAGLRSLGRGSAARGRISALRARAHADEVLGADQIHYYVMMRSAQVLGSPTGFLERGAARFDAVSEEQLDAAAVLLSAGLADLRAGAWGPGLTETTLSRPVTASTDSSGAASVAARAGSDAPPSTDDPSARRILSETLSSGLQTVLERNDDSDVFAIHLMFRPRAASEPAGEEGIASFLHRLMARGSMVLDRAGLAARLDALGATLKTDDAPQVPFDDYYTTPEFSFVRMELPSERWREGVALLAELARFPRLEADDVEAVRKEMLDLQTRRAESSRSRAQDLADRTLAPGHPLARPILGTPASIGSITVDDLKAFQRSYVSANRVILTGVSPVDAREVLDAVRGAFSALPAGDVPPVVPAPPLNVAGLTVREAASGEGPSTIILSCLFDASPEEEPALAVAGALLSDSLSFKLREELGLAYSMGASISRWGGRMRLQVTMTTRRENADKALDGLRAEIAAFTPKEDEVRRAATALRGRMLMRRLTRLNQAYYYGLERLDDRPTGDTLRRLDALMKVDAAAVRKVMAERVALDRLATFVVE
jgi:predicted Zn-dependent peptidase